MTEAVCDGRVGEGHTHRQLCSAMLDMVGKFDFIVGYGTDAPICRSVCWHACDGAHVGGQEHDSWANCKKPECAAYPCLDFLLKECQPVQHLEINRRYTETCTIVPPAPPNPPGFPPSPPLPPSRPAPRPPPPLLQYVERFKSEELDSDADCEPLNYATCEEVVRQHAAKSGPGYSGRMSVTASQCEETDVETDCFVGCAYGSRSGGTYRFLVDGMDSSPFTRPRCKMSIHPRCACTNHAGPPPFLFPPPPPTRFTQEWELTNVPQFDSNDNLRDSSKGHVMAMSQRLVNGRSLDLSLRTGPMHAFQVRRALLFPPPHPIALPDLAHVSTPFAVAQCPGDDDGRDTCALTCSNQHLGRLRAFTVTGESYALSDTRIHF